MTDSWPTAIVDPVWRTTAAIAVAAVVVVGGLLAGPVGLVLAVAGTVVVAAVLGSPVVALMVLMAASFGRLAVAGVGLPADPMVLALVAMVASAAIAWSRGALRVHVGYLELAMLAYVAWNVVSMLMPHELPAVDASTGEPIVEYRFVVTGTVVPFAGFVLARSVLAQSAGTSEDRVRRLMVFVVAVAGYSALVSILQFTGPSALVFPRYIVDDPSYPERAVGVVNQPLVNGIIMVAGFVTGMLLVQRRELGPGLRVALLVATLACLPGIYLTRTRAVWLVLGLALVACVLFARGHRRGFVATLLAVALVIGANWATFTSSDRDAGGVTSVNEVDDRLNAMATAFWAIDQKPLLGWGITRFSQVNAVHHQVWAPDVPYQRGYGIASHENELGIAAELGLVGLALWLAVVVPLAGALLMAFRKLPSTGRNSTGRNGTGRDGGGLAGRALGLVALTVMAAWVVSGFTADLRFFDYANLTVFVLVGAVLGTADRLGRRPQAPAVARPSVPRAEVPA